MNATPRPAPRPPTPRHLANRAAVRRFALDYAARIGRGDVITRVDAAVFADIDAAIRRRIVGMVERHPSAFRTLKP